MMIKKEKKTEIHYTRADVERVLREHAFTQIDSREDKSVSIVFECDDGRFCSASVYITEREND